MIRNPSAAPRVLLYSHDSFGLGHFRRSSSIAHAISSASPDASLLCVTGSPRPDLFPLPKGADYVKLPSITKDDSGAYVSQSLERDLAGVVRLRAQTLEAVAEAYAPNVILVDHAPLGVGGELLPMLEAQRRRADVSFVLGMRDILDETERARKELAAPHLVEAMEAYYDRILVYGHPEVCDIAREYQLSPRLGDRLRYVGITCCVDESVLALATRERRSNERPAHVVLSAGGGADGASLLQPAVDALCHGWDPGSVRATVITGPFLDPAEHELLMARTARFEHIRLLKATSDVYGLLATADLAITMGGYNSIYEALCMRVRVLAFPRTQPRREQYERVRRLERMGLLQALTPEDTSEPDRLRARIRACLALPPADARASGLRFEGAREAARHVLGIDHDHELLDVNGTDGSERR